MSILKLLVDYQLFPPIALFLALKEPKNLEWEQSDHFQKMQYRNRFEIRSATGLLMVTYPLAGGRDQGGKPMNEIRLLREPKKIMENWRSLYSAYNNSPFFKFYQPSLEPLLLDPPELLTDFCQRGMEWVLKQLKWKVELSHTKQWEREMHTLEILDFRGHLRPSNRLKYEMPEYYQTFDLPFEPNLSILDLLFNLGPEARTFIDRSVPIKNIPH